MTTTLHLPVFFFENEAIVEDEAHHHLFKVKRLQVGERLRVVDGKGHARWAAITGIDRRSARLALGEAAPAGEPALAVEILLAAPKLDRAAWLVEKATEIGVRAVRFISTEREARTLESSQLARLRRVAISAVEQCGRALVPEILGGEELRAAVAGAKERGTPIAVLALAGERRPPDPGAGGRIAVLVGPEGGWSAGESAFFAGERIPAWGLGPTVLRVETAAIVAAGLLLCSDVSR